MSCAAAPKKAAGRQDGRLAGRGRGILEMEMGTR